MREGSFFYVRVWMLFDWSQSDARSFAKKIFNTSAAQQVFQQSDLAGAAGFASAEAEAPTVVQWRAVAPDGEALLDHDLGVSDECGVRPWR